MKLASYVQESLRKSFCVYFDFECKVLVVRHLTGSECVTAAQLYILQGGRYWLRYTTIHCQQKGLQLLQSLSLQLHDPAHRRNRNNTILLTS